MKKITVSLPSGFCFGVKRAIDGLWDLIEKKNYNKIYTLGLVIHNDFVVDDLRRNGVENIDFELVETVEKNSIIVIRSHGIGKVELDKLSSIGEEIDVMDYTCPYVKKIHCLVEKYSKLDYNIVVVGDHNHPEVIGICGWGKDVKVAPVIDESYDIDLSMNTVVVFQTTYDYEHYIKILNYLNSHYPDVLVFNTVCKSTKERQDSCRNLALESDAMIVIGSKRSSNSRKLFDIACSNCSSSFFIEGANDVNIQDFIDYYKIGISAGASTPDSIIKEVEIKLLNDNTKANDFNMMEEIDKTFNVLHDGDRVVGKVLSVSERQIMVNVNYKSDGIIERNEITDDPDVDLSSLVKVGEDIEVVVVKVNDGDGNVVLSKKRIDYEKKWDKIEELSKENGILSAKITDSVNGGVIAVANGVKAFIPASQLDVRYVNSTKEYIGKEVRAEILEINKSKHKLVLSCKNIIRKEQEILKEKFWSNVSEGDVVEGEIRRITNFGAFIDLGGIDGLIHISDMSWTKIKHPKDLVNEGQKVSVKILKLDKENEKISLGIKQLSKSPWETISSDYKQGDIVDAKVKRITDFGAFAEIIAGIEGLIHISQLSDDYVKNVKDVITVGDVVKAKIVSIDADNGRINLSLKSETKETIKEDIEDKITE